MYVLTLADLVGDEELFLARHFGREALLRKSGLPVDPADVLSIDDLDRLLAMDSIRLPYVRVARDGTSVREATYACERVVQNVTVTDGLDPDKVRSLFRAGATVTWNSLNHVLPHLRELTEGLGDRFATRSDVIAFLTPAGKQGYAPHHDPVDVFVIQLHGTKEWQIWKTPETRRADTGHYELDELGQPEITVLLEPGDVMYVPYGTPHVATSVDRMSLHLSVAVQPRQWREHLVAVVRRLVDDDPRFWSNTDLADSGAATAALAELAEVLAEELAHLDAAREVRRLVAAGLTEDRDSRLRTAFGDLARIDRLDEESPLRLSLEFEVERGEVRNGRAELKVVPVRDRSTVPTARTSVSAGSLWVPEAVAEVVATWLPTTSLRLPSCTPAPRAAGRSLPREGCAGPECLTWGPGDPRPRALARTPSGERPRVPDDRAPPRPAQGAWPRRGAAA